MENTQGMATFAVLAGITLLGIFLFVIVYSYDDGSEAGKLRRDVKEEERRRHRRGQR